MENESWSEVARKKAKPRKKATIDPSQAQPTPVVRQQPKSYSRKPPAIMIKPAAGKSYSDTVRLVRSCGLTIADLGSRLVMRETQDGSLLMVLPRGENSAAATKKIASAFSERLSSDISRISQIGVLADIEVLDLDSCATAEDVFVALRAAATGENNPSLAAERARCRMRRQDLAHEIKAADSLGENAQTPGNPDIQYSGRLFHVQGKTEDTPAREMLPMPDVWPQSEKVHL